MAVVVKLHTVDACEQLLQVSLDHVRVRRLTENLQQIVVTDEVEPWEQGSLFLEVEKTGYIVGITGI